MARYDDDWGERRPNSRRFRKPYNDDYKEDSRRLRGGRSRYAYRDEDEDVRIYRGPEDRKRPPEREMPSREGRAPEGGKRRPEEHQPTREQRPRRPRKKTGAGCLVVLTILVLVVLLAIGGVGTLGHLWSLVDNVNLRASDVAVNPDLPDSVARETKEYRTIMIFGVDSRDTTTLRSGVLSDSNIVVAIHKSTGEVKLLSIYRDTYVETTTGDHLKLTEAYSKYGAKEQLQTINRNFDMNVTDYVTVNWKAVADTINALGGIELELSSEECSGINKYIDEVMESTGVSSSHISVEDGVQSVDGIQAVTYCRLRKGLGDDYKRTERQRTVIAKTLAKAKRAGVTKVLDVCNQIFPGISTSLSLTEVMALATAMGRYNIVDSTGFPFDNRSQDGGRYYIYPVTLASNAKKLHEYLYNNTEYTPSGTVERISSDISAFSGYY